MKWIKRILISLLVLIILVSVFVFVWLKSSAPQYAGELKLKGLHEKVDVWYDDYGVPHIYAQNNHDLYLAFGYVHAQDRLFQMEMLRRAGSGRLAEIIGRPLLKVDKMFRTIGLPAYAEASAARLEQQKDSEMYRDIQAYLDGINLFITEGDTPPEFSIIGIEKNPFTTYDLFCITGAMSFSFSQAQKTEPVVDFIAKEFGEQHLKEMGLWHGSHESYIRTSDARGRSLPVSNDTLKIQEDKPINGVASMHETTLLLASLTSDIEKLLPVSPLEGSNSWVVAGSRTENSKVLFCNDTHIGYLLPQTWYEAHLNTPDYELYGHHMAGVPFALVGRNRDLSWGLTMLLNDDMDFYNEKINPSYKDQYLYKGEPRDFTIVSHNIKIKGESDTTIVVRHTIHGPVINDAFDGMGADTPISMWWVYTQHDNRTIEALYGMNHSNDIQQFENNLSLIHAPGLNVNYGDAKGNVAWWACAKLARRNVSTNSWTILDGESGKDDIQGYYDFPQNPRCVNPSWGFIHSANEWPAPMNDSAFFSSEEHPQWIESMQWYPGYYKPQYRSDRIRKLLSSRKDWNLSNMQDVMNDHVNEADSVLMNFWANRLNNHPEFTYEGEFAVYNQLFNWRGNYDPMSPEPTFFNKMLYHFLHETMADEMGEKRFAVFLQTHQVQRTQMEIIRYKNSPWWDNIKTEEIERMDDIIFTAYQKSIRDLKEQFGSNPKSWTWNKAATLELKHPLGEVAIFRPFFNVGPHAIYGGNETIEQAGFYLDSTGQYKVHFGSQMRIMVDFANVDSSLNITPCGQSGHLMSPHYNDQATMYRKLKTRAVFMNKEKIETFKHLQLIPQ
jgi:penicillin amidase